MPRKWVNDWRFTRILSIAVPVGVTVWLFGGAPVTTAGFFALGAAYGALLFRVVSLSGRASMVMTWGFVLVEIMLHDVESFLGAPVRGPVLMGFTAGAIVGAHWWTGKKAGRPINRKRERTADGDYTGGWKPALINAVCAAVLLAASTGQLLDGVPAETLAVSLPAGFLAGWVLFRLVKSFQVRFMTFIAILFALVPALIVAGSFGYGDHVFTGLFGFLAGILIGGRYWWGPRFGAPRPPFAGKAKRRRKRKRKAKATPPKGPVAAPKVDA
ncbi:hypothetical protein [Arthrobacter sp. zg-Y1110]|uniref:hypothetical protein n=1 Tax=Arthrobacter sp. zg-Y1110 TaxID=2886932 RepID=UPI001D156BDD|nr:hypothetical protein [Arthrobacter sp. zg-Y1110]MCC3292380.1 hypothetical protein [Arthrobacter sp. zg-Y1110]UWX86717.1 hypothetical protein N2K99_17905 [Arthrobacter sp. zg-Y1110]